MCGGEDWGVGQQTPSTPPSPQYGKDDGKLEREVRRLSC